MDYKQLIEDIREEMIDLINQRCDSLLRAIESGEFFDGTEYRYNYKLEWLTPIVLKGNRPIAVRFESGECVDVKTWKKVVEVILKRCNEQPEQHEALLKMRGAVHGKQRVILGCSPDNMDVPIKIDEDMYFEAKYDAESLIRVLVNKVLTPSDFDISQVSIAYAAKKDMTFAFCESVLLQREEESGQDDTAELTENVQGVTMQGI